MIEIVSATRHSKTQFWAKTALGTSLKRLAFDSRVTARISFENRKALPDVYNARIFSEDSPDVLVFVHDDVWIDDYWIADRLIDGLQKFDIIGVAGNRQLVPGQPAWAFVDVSLTRDDAKNLSGAVAHAQHPFGPVIRFGDVPAECELLDGVLLAGRKSVMIAAGVAFDSQFDFHFYDLDFCRTARKKGLSLGTWPIAITHQSGGGFDGRWRQVFQRYLNKWDGV